MTAPDAPVIVLTFDNLGEAAELERGTWPSCAPLGDHPSVTRVLPRLLDELDERELRATFFVEGVNGELYPDAVREIAARGHGVGVHGWRHESWGELDPDRERELLARAVDALAALGLAPGGFRPPGGALTRATPSLLREFGFAWCSPAGDVFELRGGLAWVPFAWEDVDAFHLMDSFAGLRRERGAPERAGSPDELAGVLAARVLSGGAGGPRTLVLHPFLMLDDAWWAGTRELLARLASSDEVRVVSGDAYAAELIG